jgi:hypothetical protein
MSTDVKVIDEYFRAQKLAQDAGLKLSYEGSQFVLNYREIDGRDAKNIISKFESVKEVHLFLRGYYFKEGIGSK